jgi:hypothetical protein
VDLRNSPAQAVIYDHTGKLVYKGFLIPGSNTIGMNGFSAGIYRIELVMGDRIFGQSLIKQ